jgi:hypothetical protein
VSIAETKGRFPSDGGCHGAGTTRTARAAEAAARATTATATEAAAIGARATRAAHAAARATAAAGTAAVLGDADRERAPAHLEPVELADGVLGLLGRAHLDEAEAARASGLPVGRDLGVDDLTMSAEQVLQLLDGGGEREVGDKKLARHQAYPGYVAKSEALPSGWRPASPPCIGPSGDMRRRRIPTTVDVAQSFTGAESCRYTPDNPVEASRSGMRRRSLNGGFLG